MGDVRFQHVFERVRNASDRVAEIKSLSDDDVIAALGGATRAQDPLLANILATEAQNRAQHASAVTASLGEGVIVIDKRWRITMQNPAAERLLGWTSAEFVGKDPHDLFHAFCNRPDECHLATPPPPDFFFQNDDALVMRKDGRTIRVAYTLTPVTRAGKVDGGVLVLRDSSERKRQEEKSNRKQDRLERILQTLPEGVLVMDLDGRITYTNVAAEQMLGRAARDILERTYYDPDWNFVTPSGGILSVTDLPFKHAIDTGEPVLGRELGLKRGDGSILSLRVNTLPLLDANHRADALLVSFVELP